MIDEVADNGRLVRDFSFRSMETIPVNYYGYNLVVPTVASDKVCFLF
jgi:hypothetical protein